MVLGSWQLKGLFNVTNKIRSDITDIRKVTFLSTDNINNSYLSCNAAKLLFGVSDCIET